MLLVLSVAGGACLGGVFCLISLLSKVSARATRAVPGYEPQICFWDPSPCCMYVVVSVRRRVVVQVPRLSGTVVLVPIASQQLWWLRVDVSRSGDQVACSHSICVNSPRA